MLFPWPLKLKLNHHELHLQQTISTKSWESLYSPFDHQTKSRSQKLSYLIKQVISYYRLPLWRRCLRIRFRHSRYWVRLKVAACEFYLFSSIKRANYLNVLIFRHKFSCGTYLPMLTFDQSQSTSNDLSTPFFSVIKCIYKCVMVTIIFIRELNLQACLWIMIVS